MEHTSYLPAAGRDWALPLYDPLVWWLGIDSTRMWLIETAGLRPGESVLDIGCGTGSLAVSIKRAHPGVDVLGLDPDPKALDRARRKARRAGVSVEFERGYSHELRHREASFDHVFSSFMFHHLDAGQQEATLREVHRILEPGGALHLVDFAPEASTRDGRIARLVHAHHRMRGLNLDRLQALFELAGFAGGARVEERSVRFGIRVASYLAVRSSERAR